MAKKYLTSTSSTATASGWQVVFYCAKGIVAMIYEEYPYASLSVSAAREERLQTLQNLTMFEYQTDCEWDGLLQFRGKNSCDDFAWACHKNKITSYMFVGDTDKTLTGCSKYYDCPAQAVSPYMSCNFNQPISVTGKEGTELVLRCVDGIMSGVYAYYYDAPAAPVVAPSRNFINTASSSQCLSWGTAVGSWKLVQSSNQPFSYEVEFGTETSDTEGLSKEWSTTLSESMEVGIDFLTASVSVEVSQSIATSMESTLTQSYGQTFTFECPKGRMYQWVVESGRPWESQSNWGTKVSSQIMWCTLDSYEDPKCPPGACDCGDDCSTSDCQKCKSWEGSHPEGGGFVPPSCDWSGKRKLSGTGSNDDYYFDCEDDLMIGITTTSGLQGTSSCSGCNWVGVAYMAGSGSGVDDDLYLECCGTSQSIVGIYAIDGEKGDEPGNPSAGIPCSWQGKRRASGKNSDDDFYLYCENGLVTEMRAIPDLSIETV